MNSAHRADQNALPTENARYFGQVFTVFRRNRSVDSAIMAVENAGSLHVMAYFGAAAAFNAFIRVAHN